MKNILLKSFGGLNLNYLLRQYFFSILIAALLIFAMPKMTVILAIFIFLNTLLYPYARFVYESIVDYIIGDNYFILPAVFLLATKLFLMIMIWSFAVVIAPLGLIFLYFYHDKQEKKEAQQ